MQPYKKWILYKKGWRTLLLLLLLLLATPHRPLFAQGTHNPLPDSLSPTGQAIVNAVNQYRAQSSVAPLSISPLLTAAAQAHADDLATKAYFSHIARDGSNVLQRTQRSGYNGLVVGENLAGAADLPMAIQLWIDSTGHRNNMLNTEYAEIGVGFAYDATHRWMVYVTVFGRAATIVVAATDPVLVITEVLPKPKQTSGSEQFPSMPMQSVLSAHYIANTCTDQYTVRSGDTLASIARFYKTTWRQLAQFNQLDQPNLLHVGQQLCIP